MKHQNQKCLLNILNIDMILNNFDFFLFSLYLFLFDFLLMQDSPGQIFLSESRS